MQTLETRKCKAASRALYQILLERTQELPLLRGRLEGTVTELGRRVDPLELHLLQRFS